MAVSLEQFTQQLADSGAMLLDDINAFITKLPDGSKPTDGEQLAKRLVKAKKISAYQAQLIYSGKGKSLTMGGYFVLDKLGQGGMGMVLKGEHRMMKRLVAIKVLSPAVTKTKESMQRFQREVEAAARLTHPNIVGAFDAGQDNGSPFLVMEYVPGDDLSSIVKKKGPLGVDQAIDCIVQAARGLEFAHTRGVIHRDIKPANLLLDTTGVVKILDMGLARIDAADVATQADLTGTGAVMGTVDYMAPEQAVSTKTADARSDLYSLGISLWFLLTGKVAYEGDSLMSRLLAHRDQPIPSLQSVREDVSESLEAVFRKLVAKKPGDRYQTAKELIADLEACRTGSAVKALEVAEVATGADEFQVFLQMLDSPTSEGGKPGTGASTAATQTRVRSKAPSSVSLDETLARSHVSDTLASSSRVRKGGQPKAPPWHHNSKVLSGIGGGVVLLLAAIVLFSSSSGTLRVEILDPEVEMRVKGTELTFHGSNLEPVSLKAGEKKLLVTRGDLSFETEAFTLKKGTETRVKVELLGDKLVVNGGGKVIAEQPIKRKGLTTSTTGSDSVASTSPSPSTSAPPPAIAPFDAAQARAHQEAWAKHLGVPVEYTNSIGMKFVLIPPGEFLMGSTAAEVEEALVVGRVDENWRLNIQSEAPLHKVILTQPIYLGVHEVTKKQYEKVMGTNPFDPDTAHHPVVSVTWNDAAEFCTKLSQKEQLKPVYFRAGESVKMLVGNGYRLPTEAQWEFACRGGTTTKYWTGDRDESLAQAGWFGLGPVDRPHSVGELKANPLGLYDVHGNVWEWVQDSWDPTYYSQLQEKPTPDPSGPTSVGPQRVIRGGDWYYGAPFCRAATRRPFAQTAHYLYFGFRAALAVDAVKAAIVAKKASSKETTAGKDGPEGVPPLAVAPFDAAQAKRHQEAWAKHLGVPVEYANSIGMKFMLIPPGEFMMGSTAEEIEAALRDANPNDKNWIDFINSEAPQHKVILTQPTYLGVNEVTQSEYEKVMGINPSYFSPMGSGKESIAGLDTSGFPVEMVSWYDATEFCIKLSKQEKLRPFYAGANESITQLDGTGYRLPSEAEWEFACRAGTTTKRWSGDNDEELKRAGWFERNSRGRTHAAGELNANSFGLFDIHGNVWEWVQDRFEANWYGQYQNRPAINPETRLSGGYPRVFRGGSFRDIPPHFRSSLRFIGPPIARDKNFGFRVILSVDAVKVAATKEKTPESGAGKLFMHEPAFPQWVKDVQAMPAEKQLEAVSKKLVELNPGFDGTLGGEEVGGSPPRIQNGVVTELYFNTDNVTDVSPVRAFTGLTSLYCWGKERSISVLSDISPLAGMKLTRLNCCGNPKLADLSPLKGVPLTYLTMQFNTTISDLTPLTGMPLETLNIRDSQVTDLSPLKDMKLTYLDVWGCRQLSDISPLKGMKLERFVVSHAKVSDLSLLTKMPLKNIELNFQPAQHTELLRSIKTLEIINLQPAAEFWKEANEQQKGK